MSTIGQNIKAIREKAGITQDTLAETVDINRVTLAKYESDLSVPGGKVLHRIAKALHVSADVILGDGEADMSDDDKELWELREQVRREPDRRALFSLAKNADINEVRQAIAIMDALKKSSANYDETDTP